MSYFFAGFGTGPSPIKALGGIFADVMPPAVRVGEALTIEKPTSFLVDYGGKKAINDFIALDPQAGSWAAVLGTPLVNAKTLEEGPAFCDRFFADPARVVRNELDGCFAVLAYDARRGTFYAVTDRNNTTPLYYAATSSGIYFSSHELPLAKLLRPGIDPLGFSMAVQMMVTWGGQTRFKSIRKLLPSQLLSFRGCAEAQSERYWRPSEEPIWPSDFDEAIERWLGLLKQSVQAYYDNAVNKKLICDMTAGEDSRLVLAQCHALHLPFSAMVDGSDGDTDVRVAKEAARKSGFDLVVRPRYMITEEQLLDNATSISIMNDAYQDYFASCSAFATNAANPLKNWEFVKLAGAPGGEAFRGSYYLRGRAFFPSHRGHFDYRSFTRLKYLLDFYPGLMSLEDEEFKRTIFAMAKEALNEVPDFPVGIKIDHLLRVFQTCNSGLIFKNPRYLPLATKQMTGTVYSLPPIFKRGGKLTKACTEILFPELASVKTQKGVPTIRKTLLRTPLFMPEYVATAKSIASGAASRLLKWTESNKSGLKWDANAPAIKALLNKPPFSSWFSPAKNMITGDLYRREVIQSLMGDAQGGSTRYVPVLGRVINQELAMRWVYSSSH